ncbi:MAG: NAD(P)-dependent glycerol-1-phosphate dehydrogenase [Candidatus Odinarchaeia archaeon]
MRREHHMKLPREILIGAGVLSRVPEICENLGYSGRILILSGPLTVKIAGENVKNILSDSGFKITVKIIEQASMTSVKETQQIIQQTDPSVVLAVGGGKVIDVAKLSSAFEKKPFISIPTAASHDGIASPQASIKNVDATHSISADMPIAIIADTEIIAKAPYRLLASGCGDVISNSTAVKDWELAYKLRNEYYGEYSASLSEMCAELVMRNAKIIRSGESESFRIVLEALISSGVAMGIAGSSRPASGAEHMFSHSLDLIAKKHALHGEQCGVGAIMMMYLHGGDWEKIRDSLKTIGAPTTAKELGVTDEEVIEALCYAHKIRPERYTILGVKGLTKEAAERLARVTGVIGE